MPYEPYICVQKTRQKKASCSMKNILFIHQSAELYGSDKTLLTLVTDLKSKGFLPIVVLPNEGPLKIALENSEILVFILPVLKISRKMFSPFNLLSWPIQAIKSLFALQNLSKKHKIDIVYSNTLAVLVGFLFAKFFNKKHIWHIHEIIEQPKFVSKIFSNLIRSKNNTQLIFNSFATQKFWENQSLKEMGANKVVWNGIEEPYMCSNQTINEQNRWQYWQAEENNIVIALVGRINKWKGHRLLLEAFQKISSKYPNIILAFIGSCPPGQDYYLTEIEQLIAKMQLEQRVIIKPFQTNIFDFWTSIDIAVVPSTEPEPFGLVAIEAMMASKPVIAARHGGLSEIVVHNETGILFEPKNIESLAAALEELINDGAKRKKMGMKGHIRAENNFSSHSYSSNIELIINGV